ncbi:MAG: hypothetical protein ACTHM8_14100 [Sphingomonas sp.]
MLSTDDIAMIVQRIIAYWLIILLVIGVTFVAVRMWRARRRNHSPRHHRHRRRR